MLPPLCICDLIVPVEARTQVICVLHKMEQWKTTNTGHLMSRVLTGCECRVRGEQEQALDTRDFDDPTRRTWVLFPCEEARVIDAALVASDPRPVRLVVPDATWQQARRIVRRVDALQRAPKVTLPQLAASRYRLRKHGREGGLCTYEAITEALCLIEGEALREPLERILRVFVERTLWSRGEIKASEVEGGISDEALQWKGSTTRGVLQLREGTLLKRRERHDSERHE